MVNLNLLPPLQLRTRNREILDVTEDVGNVRGQLRVSTKDLDGQPKKPRHLAVLPHRWRKHSINLQSGILRASTVLCHCHFLPVRFRVHVVS